MKTVRPILQGEKLLTDSGPLPRVEMLRIYGYLSNANARYDLVELSQRMVVDQIQRFRKLEQDDLARRVGHGSIY